MGEWERSLLGMSGAEQDLQEAVVALQRVLSTNRLETITRVALKRAVRALQNELR